MIQPAVSNSAPTRTVPPALPKVLRIGLVVEGKIKQERLVRVGESVTIGKGNATFQVDDANLTRPLEIFSYSKADKTYVLTVPEWVDGRAHWKGGIKTLAEIRADSGATKKGDLWTYALNDAVRGKLNIGGAVLLFQFVSPPPEPLRMVPESLRPYLFNREEPLFTSLTGAFGAIGVAFMVVINTYDVPIKPTDPLDIVFLAAHAATLPPKVMLRERKTTVTEQSQAAVSKVISPKKAPAAHSSEKRETSKPQTRGEALANTALGRRLQAIGTVGFGKTGAGTTTPTFGIVASDGGGDAKTFMPSTGGAPAAGATFSGGKVGEAVIGGGGLVAAAGGGSIEVRKMTAPTAVDQPPTSVEPGDDACIKKTRSYSRRIQNCVESMFAAHPKASGPITVKWDVVDGHAVGVNVVTNQTGDTAFAACVTNQINLWNFGDLTCSVPGYTWWVSSL